MEKLRVSLFGRFSVECRNQVLDEFNGNKFIELFCYLLLYRNRPHHRETLVNLFWEDVPIKRSRACLRKALWQLRSMLDAHTKLEDYQIILVDSDWVQINTEANFWLDIDVFEQAYNHVQGIPGWELDPASIQNLDSAVEHYKGDLLEGLYQDWCLYERERFKHMYLIMLDKLMDYYEAHNDYEAALTYGLCNLRYDQARERTHRRLMRLYYLTGDRTKALRQYDRCMEILNQELGVKPAKRTLALYERIRADQPIVSRPKTTNTAFGPPAVHSLDGSLDKLKKLQTELFTIQSQIRQEVESIEILLSNLHKRPATQPIDQPLHDDYTY